MFRSLIARRVAHGAMLLDYRCPGWFLKVDPSTLKMMNTDSCILGQVYDGGYFTGLKELGLHYGIWESAQYGFNLGPLCFIFLLGLPRLRRAWCREISSRRVEALKKEIEELTSSAPGTISAS